jgi:hypothetical protein
MMGVRPMVLEVRGSVDPRVELARYAPHDGARAEARAVEEMIRRERELLPVKRTMLQRLLRWGQKRPRRGEDSLAVGPAVWGRRDLGLGGSATAADELAEATLAAMPAARAGQDEGAEPAPLAAALARGCAPGAAAPL